MSKKTDIRTEKLNDGQINLGFELNGRKHKPLTGAGLKFLERIKSPIYTSDYKDYPELDIIVEYLFATSATPQELAEGAANWDVLQFTFAADYTVGDLTNPAIVKGIMRDITNQNAATVDVKAGEGKKSITPIG